MTNSEIVDKMNELRVRLNIIANIKKRTPDILKREELLKRQLINLQKMYKVRVEDYKEYGDKLTHILKTKGLNAALRFEEKEVRRAELEKEAAERKKKKIEEKNKVRNKIRNKIKADKNRNLIKAQERKERCSKIKSRIGADGTTVTVIKPTASSTGTKTVSAKFKNKKGTTIESVKITESNSGKNILIKRINKK